VCQGLMVDIAGQEYGLYPRVHGAASPPRHARPFRRGRLGPGSQHRRVVEGLSPPGTF
jgi:hypothetical protein